MNDTFGAIWEAREAFSQGVFPTAMPVKGWGHNKGLSLRAGLPEQLDFLLRAKPFPGVRISQYRRWTSLSVYCPHGTNERDREGPRADILPQVSAAPTQSAENPGSIIAHNCFYRQARKTNTFTRTSWFTKRKALTEILPCPKTLH